MLTFRVIHFSSKPLAGITDGSVLFWATLFKRNYLLLVASLSTRVGRGFGGTAVRVSNVRAGKRGTSLLVCAVLYFFISFFLYLFIFTPFDQNR